MEAKDRTAIGFVIMRIGDPSLDRVYDTAIAPTLRARGLEPKRVDKHNEGDLLKSEIVRFIEEATIIVADLTGERPNCYLEVGYAMGLGKRKNLILTARGDHSSDDPSPAKIHFDLAGYEITFWQSDELDEFSSRLGSRIRNRQRLLHGVEAARSIVDDLYWAPHRMRVRDGLSRVGLTGFMEFVYSPRIKRDLSQNELLLAAREAQSGGWPVGVVLNDGPFKPLARADGILAEVTDSPAGLSYDYWFFRSNCEFFSTTSLLEDYQPKNLVLIDVRIRRIAEVFQHCARLYERLGYDKNDQIGLHIAHYGLAGRELRSTGPKLWPFTERSREENAISSEVYTSIADIENDLLFLVKQVCEKIFVLFDFASLDDSTYQRHVTQA